MLRADVRSAFQYGLAIFMLTALLGLLNATQLLGALDRNTLLTHLHSGTLGWITMGVIGIAVWMFGGATKNMAVRVSALSTAAYVLAFWSGNFYARATFGTTELLVILYWWWFAVSSARAEGFGRIEIPRLSVVLGLTTLVIGSTLGVIVQIMLAMGSDRNPGDLVGGHAGAQVGGYLVLIGAGVAEWRLTGGARTRAGLAQAGALFAGGVVLAIGILLNIQPLLLIATILQVVGIVIVVVRFGRRALEAPWGTAGAIRHSAIAVPWLVIGLILEIMLIGQIIAAQGDFSKVSVGLNHALDHAMFVGLMTNTLFGAIFAFTADRPRSWPWADQLVFWGLNVGAAAFVAVLVFVGSGEGAKPFTHPVSFVAPIMGLAALLGVATLLMRLQGSEEMAATAPMRA
ncbi:MAG: hypothetical protein M3R54_06135 [Chloroflexota bacterium]|nr:hypothetical protein [Chloroflexota bacterium]